MRVHNGSKTSKIMASIAEKNILRKLCSYVLIHLRSVKCVMQNKKKLIVENERPYNNAL